MHRFLNDSRRGVDELAASLDNQRMNLLLHARQWIKAASMKADARRWSLSLSLRVDGTSTPAPAETAIVVNGSRVLRLTRS
jgi:hypothetical protein